MKTLKKLSGCHFVLLFLSILVLVVMALLATSGSYPAFTQVSGMRVHETLAGLLLLQVLISLLGYFSMQSESACLIDIYIGCSGILIVSDVIVLAFFLYFGQ